MRLLLTKDCESHHTNPNYQTLLVVFDGSEFNVRPRGFRGNWQPTDKEVMGLVRELAFQSPTFAEQLVSFVVTLNTWKPVKNPRVLTEKTPLAEMLL